MMPIPFITIAIVKNNEVNVDWSRSELMWEEPTYVLGLVINHNYPNPKPYAGSAVFLRLWKDPQSGMAG